MRRLPPALGTLTLLLGAILLFTWPWAPNFLEGTPAGSEPSTLTHFHLGLLEWARASARSDTSWWDPPFFAPFSGVNAWSEPQPLMAAWSRLTAPLLDPVPAYNLLLLGYLLLLGGSGTAIAQALGLERPVARLVGVWLAAGPMVSQQLGAPHLVAQGFPYLCLLGALRLSQEPAPRHLWLAAAGLLLTGLSGSQNLVFLLLVLPAFLLPIAPLRRPEPEAFAAARRLAPHALAASLGGAAIFAVTLLPQLERLQEMGNHRELAEVVGVFHLAELITPADGHWLGSGRLGLSYAQGWYSWDMGVVLLLVGLLGQLALRRRPSRAALALGAASLFGLLLGFGPAASLELGGLSLSPYAWLHATLPGLDGLRSPAHVAPFPALGAALFGAVGLSRLKERWPRWPWLPLVGALVFAEMWSPPARVAVPAPETLATEAALTHLRSLPAGAAGAELPMSTGDAPIDYEGEVVALRRALRHGHPVANGYSGYFPTAYFQLRTAWLADPLGKALRYSEAMGLSWLWVHPSAPGLSEALSTRLGPPEWAQSGEAVYRLAAPAPRRGALPASAKPRQAPGAGDFISLRLPTPLAAATLFTLSPPAEVTLTVAPSGGEAVSAALRVSGSALVDEGQSRVWLLIQAPPAEGAPGRARLAAAEELPASAP